MAYAPPALDPLVVASVCFDLGGPVKKWRTLIEALQYHGYSEAERWNRVDQGWQVAYQVSHAPVLLVESATVELTLDGLAPDRASTREIRLYPGSGAIVFRFIMVARSPDLQTLYSIRSQFEEYRRGGYIDYLKEMYATDAERLDDLSDPGDSHGITMVPVVKHLRGICQPPLIDPRPALFPPLLARVMLCVDGERDRIGLEADLKTLAAAKGLSYPADTISGLFEPEDVERVRIRAWPGITVASWEGFEVYAAASSDPLRQSAIDSFELAHVFAFLCRAWIGILDDMRTVEIPRSDLDERELQALVRRIIELSALEQKITNSMAEIDSADIMLVNPLRLQFALDYAIRFHAPRARDMVLHRLQALDRQTTVIRDVLNQTSQEAAQRQATNLQLLFAGAVAATIMALVPEVAAVHGHEKSAVIVVTASVTVVLWVLIVVAITRVFRRRIHLAMPDAAAGAAGSLRALASATDEMNSRAKSP